MKPEALRFFVCPWCHGDLRLESAHSGDVETGDLRCTRCPRSFPIVRGIPRFVDGEDYTDTFGRQWNRWSTTQHDSVNGTTIFRDRMLRYTGWTPESMAGKVVVDAGCGPGGFIDVVEGHARAVVGFDLSTAIDACHRLHGAKPNVFLAQGDIFRPPVRPRVADRLYTFGVVQHTPDPERAFRSLIPLVEEGGEIAVWVYKKRLIPQPTYWLRAFTAGMPEPKATKFVEWFTPRALKVSGALAAIPQIGMSLRRLVPVADYRGKLPLTPEQHLEWSIMDTHDGLITRYTYPQRLRDLRRWMNELEDIRQPTASEMAVVAQVPRPATQPRPGAARRASLEDARGDAC